MESLHRILENPLVLLDCLEEEIPFTKNFTKNFTKGITNFMNGVFNRRETPTTIYLDMSLPGVPLENIIINVENGVIDLSIKDSIRGDNDNTYQHNFIGLHRTLKLPTSITDDIVKADHYNGVLTLSYPNHQTSNVNTPRRVHISSSS